MTTIRFQPRKKSSLIIGMLFFFILIGLVIFVAPDAVIIVILFFLILFLALFYILNFVFNSPRQSLLMSSGITLVFILRSLGLHHWLYSVLIGALITTIEVYMLRADAKK